MFINPIYLKSVLVSFFLIMVAVGLFRFLSFAPEVSAQVLPTLPFVGRILLVIPCTCSYGHVVILSTPSDASFHFTPTTLLYQFLQTKRIGAWLLGNYIPGTGNQCLIHSGDDCRRVPNLGTMTIVGTSL